MLRIWSLSARRAWIEIIHRGPHHIYLGRSLSARRAWIEMGNLFCRALHKKRSLSARRAWIEMLNPHHPAKLVKLSLSARRAWIEIFAFLYSTTETSGVALRKESVDRNVPGKNLINSISLVALRKESVDRNARKIRPVAPDISSLSARRAWIEISQQCRL